MLSASFTQSCCEVNTNTDFQRNNAAYSTDIATVIPRHWEIPKQEAVSVARRLQTADTARYYYRLGAKRT